MVDRVKNNLLLKLLSRNPNRLSVWNECHLIHSNIPIRI